jgi:Domain of Unknown Function with PDB structure (DUF3857)
VQLHLSIHPYVRALASSCLLAQVVFSFSQAKQAPQNPPEKPAAKTSAAPAEPQNPYQIELLETSYRFEANGDSRKEVHTRVHVNNELGVRQFARLNFDYNRSFQSIEIPLVHITHANGGTADILPSAITDNPNPAVVNAPAYQDVRIKSVRILGLEPSDTLEYRIITATTHHPLAPDFWLDHSFDRSGIVSEEHFQIVLPASVLAASPLIVTKNQKDRLELESRLGPEAVCSPCGSLPPKVIQIKPMADTLPQPEYGKIQLFVKPSASKVSIERSGQGSGAQVSLTWQSSGALQESDRADESGALQDLPDIEVGRTLRWPELSFKLYKVLSPPDELPKTINELSRQLSAGLETPLAKAEGIYDFVSVKLRTVDLSLGATGFKPRALEDILPSGYATQEDKFFLFQALAKAAGLEAEAALIGPSKKISSLIANPARFNHLLVSVNSCVCLLDPSLEVAPFRVLPASYRGSTALFLGIDTGPMVDLPPSSMIGQIPQDLPFPSVQKVALIASLDDTGKLAAKVSYTMRGDNELLLRLAFHQSPKEKWKELAHLLSISDGFRGQITTVTASDSYATKEPFTVEYEITQPKFVDWSKKSVRIPALLPQLGLPDPPAKPAAGGAPSPIELGTPLEVETHATLQLPPGTTINAPTGTSVQRDYATFTSQYSVNGQTIIASRHIRFLFRELPAKRAADYNAFLRAVQNDQAQDFTLNRESSPASATKP